MLGDGPIRGFFPCCDTDLAKDLRNFGSCSWFLFPFPFSTLAFTGIQGWPSVLSWVGGGFNFFPFASVALNLSARLLGGGSRFSVGKEEVHSFSIFIGTMTWLHTGLAGKH